MHGKTPSSTASKGHRAGRWRGIATDFRLFEMDEMKAGNVVNGPAVIEHPATRRCSFPRITMSNSTTAA